MPEAACWNFQLLESVYLVFPSTPPTKVTVKMTVMSNSLQPHELYSPWNSLGQNTGVGSLSLLLGIFPTQGMNPGLPHWGQILYQLSHKGSPRILEWVAYPFSNRSSWPRNWTRISCIAGVFFTNWTIREALFFPQNCLISIVHNQNTAKATVSLKLHALSQCQPSFLCWVNIIKGHKETLGDEIYYFDYGNGVMDIDICHNPSQMCLCWPNCMSIMPQRCMF